MKKEKLTKHAGGRPSDYTQELADTVCERISEGNSLRNVCLNSDLPDARTIFRWLRVHEEFRHQYDKACVERSESHHEDLLNLGDEAIELSQHVDPKASGAVVSAYKLKADNQKWSMSKMKPKKYGDKIDMTSAGEKLPTPIMAIANVSTDNSNKQDRLTDEEN